MLRALIALALLLMPAVASAYPFMITHGYTNCAQCHVDPSGGGALTEYGRGQAEILLRTPWTERADDWEPGPIKDFLGGVPLPEWLVLQGDARGLLIPEPSAPRIIVMQSDLRAAIEAKGLVAYVSAAYADEGASGAWVSSNASGGGNVVSREFWGGWKPTDDLLIRGGRMALPFGIRSEEHLLFARSATDTDINDGQQVGPDVVWNTKKVRAELMAILGNFQVSPDAFRERGYSLATSYAVSSSFELGLSSLLAHAVLDTDTLTEQVRQAHGAFARIAPLEHVAVLTEADMLVDGTLGPEFGTTGYLQLDVEPTQGLHLKGTGEWCDDDLADADAATLRGSATALWFVAPHVDVRADALYGTLSCTPGLAPSFLGLAQLHFFL